MIHSSFDSTSYGVTGELTLFTQFRLVFTDVFLNACVPSFFILSGFLYFKNVDCFSWLIYKKKTISRCKSLLLPFIISNVLFLAINYAVNRSSDFISIVNGLFGLFGFPANPPLWFIRDLFLVCLLSPIIYFLANRIGFLIVSVLAYLWISDIWFSYYPNILSINSFLFFYLGAFIAIHKSLFRVCNTYRSQLFVWLGVVYISFVTFYVLTRIDLLAKISYLFCIPMLFCISEKISTFSIISRINIKNLVAGTMFVYLYHYYVALIIPRIFLSFFGSSGATPFIIYFLSGLLTFSLMLCSFYILRKFTPQLINIILGGRNV